jgi:hypothetical protein
MRQDRRARLVLRLERLRHDPREGLAAGRDARGRDHARERDARATRERQGVGRSSREQGSEARGANRSKPGGRPLDEAHRLELDRRRRGVGYADLQDGIIGVRRGRRQGRSDGREPGRDWNDTLVPTEHDPQLAIDGGGRDAERESGGSARHPRA